MLVHNEDVARAFDQMVDVLERQQANPFRIRAYRNAARTLRGLDLSDRHCQIAKEEGVLVGIGADAHRTTDFGILQFGVMQAGRGWLEAKDVLEHRTQKWTPLLGCIRCSSS
jgi:Helix-hairpin-helix domain